MCVVIHSLLSLQLDLVALWLPRLHKSVLHRTHSWTECPSFATDNQTEYLVF